MKVSIRNGKLLIDVHELLSELTPDEKRGLVDTLACEDAIIQAVSDQILTGWTAMDSHGSRGGTEADPHTPLDKAIRAVALGAGTVASQELASMGRSMRRQAAYHDQISRWAWDMYHTMANPPPPPSAYDATPDDFLVVAKEKTHD